MVKEADEDDWKRREISARGTALSKDSEIWKRTRIYKQVKKARHGEENMQGGNVLMRNS